MMPPKPTRVNYRMKFITTSSRDISQPDYEDLDALVPAGTDGSQSEVNVRPVPRPRSKFQPKGQSNTDNTVDKSSNLTNAPPAVSTERLQNPPPPPRPERLPPLSIYYNRPLSSMSYTEDSRLSTISSMRQTPVSPAFSEEVVNLYGTYDEMATNSTERPAVPPRLCQSSSLPRSSSVCETLPPQTRPPPPPFNPPSPPSTGTPSESAYSEIEHRPYLDILPEEKMTKWRSMPRSGLHFQSGCFSSRQEATEVTDDIDRMLRWLTRVSKSDDMSLSVHGLSIEEEIRSFNQRAVNVNKALRLYNLLMMKRSESLRNVITELSSISNNLDKMQKKTKTMGIAGGTTGAVGGVTAVVGIALAPMTMGASLIATAVGAGMVASAGGMGTHTVKANRKIVNRMTVEKLVSNYKANIVDLGHCLAFILSEMNELRRHDIARVQRAGAQPDALKMAHLSQSVFRNNTSYESRTSVIHTAGMSSERLLLAFTKDMDQFFTGEDGQNLKNSTRSRNTFSDRVHLLAENLQDELDHLNLMWEMFS
ncbi:uncharacterized protein LOC120806095 isoform X2 [Xiphias gladius]|uniref:uncharacterized protein LOC120806095 isoform X2 n=1 Tax=Xiphias gladius TaxID=8245 RepID=UPI001A981136|nr:uncharacterized protein LOC120806095 isoform X2 [Xiphias gladius]